MIWRLENSDCVSSESWFIIDRIDSFSHSLSNSLSPSLFIYFFLLSISATEGSTAALNHLFVSFLFVFQNDNELIDNDNAGQSPAAQAVVLTILLLLSSQHCSVLRLAIRLCSSYLTHTYTQLHSCLVSYWARTAKVSTISHPFFLISVPTSFAGIKRCQSCRIEGESFAVKRFALLWNNTFHRQSVFRLHTSHTCYPKAHYDFTSNSRCIEVFEITPCVSLSLFLP